MSSIHINQDGHVSVNGDTRVRAGETAAQSAYTGGGNVTYYKPGSNASIRWDGTEYVGNYQEEPKPVGTINGQTFYDEQEYSAAKERTGFKKRQEENDAKAKAGREQKQGIAALPKTMEYASGLSADDVEQQVEQEERKPKPSTRQRTVASGGGAVTESVETPLPDLQLQEADNVAEPLQEVPTEPTISQSVPEQRSVGRPRKDRVAKSRIAETMKRWDEEASDGRRTTYLSPSDVSMMIDMADPDIHDRMVLSDALRNWVDPTPAEIASNRGQRNYYAARHGVMNDFNNLNSKLQDTYLGKRQQVQDSINKANERAARGALSGLDDAINMTWVDLGNAKTEEEQLQKLKDVQQKRSEKFYKRFVESPSDNKSGFDNDSAGQRPWMDDEAKVQRKFAKVRDMIRLRLINPALMSIQSEHVQTKEEKHGRKTTVKGRIRYSKEVEDAIHNIVETYNCSIRDVMALVQLRAGLGVDLKGKIGGKKASKFKLSDAQFVELCKDIQRSQQLYGHPMAIVDGAPGGNQVRDDSGKFVVVGGTRCFPLGYVPTYLLANLSKNKGSALYGQPVGYTANLIRNAWLNETYPSLINNATGNIMWQARAIENMMRAVMSMDGINPAMLNIPDIVINKTMMQIANEKKDADPSIARGLEVRERREKRANEIYKHRYSKNNGGRDKDGNIMSPARRITNAVGNGLHDIDSTLHGISSLGKAAKTADLFLLVTSPFEAVQSMMEQSVADRVLEYMFYRNNESIREQYKVSDRLEQAALTKEGIEARNVAETLYRIGGWVAVDAFLSEVDAKGRAKYRMTNSDVQKFLADYGVTGKSVPVALMEKLHIDPKFAQSFQSNINGALNFLEDTLLCSGLFQEKEAGQFVKLSMLEMAKSSVNGRESFTTAEVEEWANIGSEEMMRSLLRTDAGREAFMTQGITSLGRKSPMDYAVRQIMSANGFSELMIRTCFDRFPEYGLNKIMRQVPASNTLSYLASYGIDGLGSFLNLVNEDNNVSRYQVGGTYGRGLNSFTEGFIKNLMYDTAMAGNRLLISAVYWGVLQMFGGVHRPPLPEDEFNWSEWIIGNQENGEYGLPIKWAWFMDDLSGVGLPLGAAWAIASSESNSTNPWDWTPEAKDIAARTFMNAVANFNDGTALFDALDLFNNLKEESDDAQSLDSIGTWLNPSPTEKRQTSYELFFWKFVGDMTPTVAKQLLPWSRDFIARGGDPYDRTAAKVYNNRNQENGDSEYSMEEAISQYRVTDVKSYNDYMLRLESKNNPVMALFLDLWKGAGFFSDDDNEKTGYMFTEMPYKTEVDQLAKIQWDKYSLDESKLPRDANERKEKCRSWAEWICQDIDANYKNPADALEKGFIMNPTARRACQEYCNWMIYSECDRQKNERIDELREEMGMRYLPDDIYESTVQTYEDMKDHYRMLYNNYFGSDSEIPWRLPRYKVLDSDTETRYVDSNGNAAVNPYVADVVNALSYAVNSDYRVTPGEAEMYRYGNRPNSLPYYSPERTLGFANQSEPYWVRRDENGNVTTDTNGIYNMLSDMQGNPDMTEEELAALRDAALAARDQMYGDRGKNAVPTAGKRGLDNLDVSMPEGFTTYYDPEQASKELGFPAFDKDKAASADDVKKLEDRISSLEDLLGGNGGGGSYGGGGGGGSRYYYSGGGGGGYSSSYNPKIYSNAKSVYSQRASGMSSRQPYKATNTYLRPAFYTSGSRTSYRRQE